MRSLASLRALVCLTSLVALAPSPAAGDDPTRDILWTEKKAYSYGNEEVIIRDFFQDKRDGFFVDIGCAWPIKNSNTYFLEKNLGWKGIGVDGLPDYAKGWSEQRPQSTFLNFMVTERSDAKEKFYKVGVWGLSTAEKDVAKDLKVVGEIEVPGITLDDLLERQGVKEIDLLSIDVEGHQKSVLAGFDLKRWKPKLVCIEDEGPLSVAWFRERGYAPIERYRLRDTVNWYFAPKDVAAAVDARETERGREERRKREERLDSEGPGAALHGYMVPQYILGPDGMAVPNPRWQKENAARPEEAPAEASGAKPAAPGATKAP